MMLVREVITDAKTGEVSERWVDVPGVMNDAEGAAADLLRRADEARALRAAKLAASDWSMLPDVPLDEAAQAAWATYRQALRDVTDQAGFPDQIDWPVEPT
jgi:hypothetical protein